MRPKSMFGDWLNENGKSNYKRLTQKEQLKEEELKRGVKILSQLMVDYIKNNPN